MHYGLYYNGIMLRRFSVLNDNYMSFVKWVLDHGYNIVYVHKSMKGEDNHGNSVHENEL